jgi:hypothetical protein
MCEGKDLKMKAEKKIQVEIFLSSSGQAGAKLNSHLK